jgi:hypothetical protein
MPNYNATLIQDVSELIGHLERPLWGILAKFNPQDYRSIDTVYEWIIREEIEELNGLSVVDHHHIRDPFRRIRNKLDHALSVPLSTIITYHVKAPQIYQDNHVVQVDLKGWDLIIQYYRHGMQSDLKLDQLPF